MKKIKHLIDFLKEVEKIKHEILATDGCDFPLFRGHANGSWKLEPTLFREYQSHKEYKDIFDLEAPLFHDFISTAGNYLKTTSKWEVLFLMRHHGIPTRLLDWSENIFVAFFFAILDNPKEINHPCIWILNPYLLNKKTKEIGHYIINPELELPDYFKMFCQWPYEKLGKKSSIKKEIPKKPIALYPYRNNERIISQSGLFTMHGYQPGAIEKTVPESVTQLEIPFEVIEEIELVLKAAGFHKFYMYRDFDSLATYLKDYYLSRGIKG